jgi:protocatechuate 3,4-dioxygenase beta subunit
MTPDHELDADHGPDRDDRHDRGLLYDLSVLSARRTLVPAALASATLPRRRALQLLGGAGLGLVLAACGSKAATDTSAASSSSSTNAGGATATTLGSTEATGGSSSSAIPEETGGPFPGDGSNGPDVLSESGVVRQDITSSFGDYSGTADGVPLGVDLTIVSAADSSPLPAAALYLWHCTMEGGYSLYSPGVEDQNFLRGVQEADGDGALSFTTIFPAAYDGRWPHMHFEMFPSLDDATDAGSRLVTSQLALPADICQAVYESDDGYSASIANLARTSLDTDMVFSDGYDLQVPAMSGSIAAGDLRLALTIPVNA